MKGIIIAVAAASLVVCAQEAASGNWPFALVIAAVTATAVVMSW